MTTRAAHLESIMEALNADNLLSSNPPEHLQIITSYLATLESSSPNVIGSSRKFFAICSLQIPCKSQNPPLTTFRIRNLEVTSLFSVV
jgi:hypothetical protein